MAEKVLSQEEIDALLNAMDKGDVDLDVEEKKDAVVETYDLTLKSTNLHDQFDALEEVYDKFIKLTETSLASSLQSTIEVEIVSTEMVKFGEFIQGFSNPTNFSIFNMDPLIGSAMLAIEPNLVFSLIDCMFGGNGKPLNQVREFTLIEQRMMKKFVFEVLNNLEKSWEVVLPINIHLKRTESKPEYVNLTNPKELMIIIVFSLKGSEFAGNIHLCIAYLMLEPIKNKLSTSYLRDKDKENAFSSQIRGLLKNTPVNIIAELGKTVQSVGSILNFEIGDVLKLNKGPQDPITINIEGVPKFRGSPGIVKGNRAVQISTLLHQNVGMDNHGYN